MAVLSYAAPWASARDPAGRVERFTAAGRVLVALGLAAAASLASGRSARADAVVWLCGLVWLPYAAVLLFRSRRPSRSLRLAASLADVALLSAVQALLPAEPGLVLFAALPPIVSLGYLDGWSVSTAFGGLMIAGSVLAVRLSGAGPDPVLHGAALLAYVAGGAALDVTARARGADRRRARHEAARAEVILASVAESVVVTSGDGSVIACNPATELLVGRDPDALLGLPCHEALALADGRGPLTCATGCALLGVRDGTVSAQAWRERADGSRQPVLVSAAKVAADEAADGEVVHSVRDITAIREAEEAKSLFLATASHELKTPITVIHGFAQMLLDGHDLSEPERRRALDSILGRASELSRIVERLLEASRIEAGRAEVRPQWIDLAQVVRERVAAFAAAHGLEIAITLPTDRVDAWADPSAVDTIVDHLLDNARTYSAGTPWIAVEVARRGRPVLTIADHGVGMDAEQVARCFDKFWQGGVTDGRRGPGTGLGLYIVGSLADAMGADIGVDSTPGVGTTFTVAFAAQPPAPDDAAARAPSPDVRRSEIREFMRQLGLPTGMVPR